MAELMTTPSPSQLHRYVHLPLDRSRQQIRLLKFPQNQIEYAHQIECEIRTFDLLSAPAYYALSYTWGPSIPVFRVLIDGGFLEIGRNLSEFCKEWCYRAKEKSEYIWADQLCINQVDTLERNHQVELMSRIFSKAITTIVWLDDSPTAIPAVPSSVSISQAATEIQAALIPVESLTIRIRKRIRLWKRRLNPVPEPSPDPEASPDLEYLLCNLELILGHRYFTRLWIVQEVLLSANVHIYFEGGARWTWSDLDRANSEYWKWRRKLDRPQIRSSAGMLLSKCSQSSVSQRQNMELWDCIQDFSRNDCQDPRDKVYAFMGLVKQEQRLEIDYHRTIPEILLDIFRSILEAGVHRGIGLWFVEELSLTEPQVFGFMRLAQAVIKEDNMRWEWIASSMTEKWSLFGDPSKDIIKSNLGRSSPVTSMGFEPSTERSDNIDHWWYEMDRIRIHIPCTVADAERFTTSFTTVNVIYPSGTLLQNDASDSQE